MVHLLSRACVVSVCTSPYLLLRDADVAQVRFEGLVRLLGEHPVAAERLAEDGLQEEVRLLRVVHHHHEERHHHDQTGGDDRLPLWGGERGTSQRNAEISQNEPGRFNQNFIFISSLSGV